MRFRRALIAVVVVAAVAAPAMAASGSAANETARLTVRSTRSFGSVTVHNGAPAGLGDGTLILTLQMGSKQAVLSLTAPGGKTKYSVTIGTFLQNGGTWIVPGSAVGSSAASVAMAIFPEGKGAGTAKGKNTPTNYAKVNAYTEKSGTASATLGLGSSPLTVGHTSFAITAFYGRRGCQVTVDGPQIHNKTFNVGVNLAQVAASPKGNEAFVVTASHYHG